MLQRNAHRGLSLTESSLNNSASPAQRSFEVEIVL
jgi:hypothetical protein